VIQQESKKQQLAKQLGVNIRVLEQYLQVKRAEVMLPPNSITPTSKVKRTSFRMPHYQGSDYGDGKSF